MTSSTNYVRAPEAAPKLQLPSSNSTVQVSVIEPGGRIDLQAIFLIVPEVGDMKRLVFPSYSFLIEHSSGRKILFDLSVKKDWHNIAPHIYNSLLQADGKVNVPNNVIDVLNEHGVQGKDIDTIVWSHYHFDHTGDVTTFPPSTTLVVGPGFKEQLLPGYPTNPNSPILEADWANRELREIAFDQGLRVGPWRAYDFFGDGSFYLLDTPGHAIGHMSGLARTTHDTFVLMGGDCAHHCGVFRPTPYLPLPATLSDPRQGGSSQRAEDFLEVHPRHSPISPFYEPSAHIAADIKQNILDIKGLQIFDADPNVLTIVAHDGSFLELSDSQWFPKTINDWKKFRLKEKAMWGFLRDLKAPGK